MPYLEERIKISFRSQPAMEPEVPEGLADQIIELTEKTGDETSTQDKDASLQNQRKPQRQQSSEDEIDLDLVFEAQKEKFKKLLEVFNESAKNDNLDWGVLYQEIKNLVGKQRSRSWKEIGKLFATTLALTLLPTLFDVGTDGLTLNGFINGAYYTKIPTFTKTN